MKPIFTFGKYKGETIEHVLDKDPSYIRWAYENCGFHGGVDRNSYLAACYELDELGEPDETLQGLDGKGSY